jgi:hypothetical protein
MAAVPHRADLLGDRAAAALAVLVYVTSTGFLSGFTMLFTPGKPLSGPLFVLVIWLMLRLDRSAQAGQLFHQAPRGVTYALLLALFLGLLLDEIPIFALVLPPLLFPERFVRRPVHSKHLAAAARAAAVYSMPIVAFLSLVLLHRGPFCFTNIPLLSCPSYFRIGARSSPEPVDSAQLDHEVYCTRRHLVFQDIALQVVSPPGSVNGSELFPRHWFAAWCEPL